MSKQIQAAMNEKLANLDKNFLEHENYGKTQMTNLENLCDQIQNKCNDKANNFSDQLTSHSCLLNMIDLRLKTLNEDIISNLSCLTKNLEQNKSDIDDLFEKFENQICENVRSESRLSESERWMGEMKTNLTFLISESDIKYVIISSLEVPANYYNDFIDYLYSNINEAKLSVNAMIGNFKPKPREQWESIAITRGEDNGNEAFNYYLNNKGSFIDVRVIDDINYYQIYSTTISTRQETEAPIYNQILELEAIELHKLKKIIESKGGLCLDFNTDCISCVFKKDKLPDDILDYYYDDNREFPKYKLDSKETRLQCGKMEKYTRVQRYSYEYQKWTITNDIDDNDFKPLVDQILDSKKSINIDGRAGTGKSTLINMLQAEMKIKKISFQCVAPTNKAARVVNGKTIHKFVLANSSRKIMSDNKYEYLFIDEISMVCEHFYKFFITLKRLKPDLKFIIAGDFLQLLPVNDRVLCDYKKSPAMYELCDGQRLQLSRCRRADDELFNLTSPDNINKLRKCSAKAFSTLSPSNPFINIC